MEHIEVPPPVHGTRSDSHGDPCGTAKLPAEEPDALMHARPGPWEPWRATARATQPDAHYTSTRTQLGVADECRINPRKPKGGKGIGETGLAGEDGAWQPTAFRFM